MTRISDGSSRSRRAFRRGMRRYRLAVAATVAVLLIAVTGLGAVSLTRGPRVLETEANGQALIERPGQRLILHTDRILDPIDAAQVTVSPATPIEVQVRDRAVEVRFLETLDYAAEYTIRVHGASGSTGAAGDLVAVLHTPDPQTSVLRRAPGAEPDQVIRRALGGGAEEVLFTAPVVQEAVLLAGAVAAITRESVDAAPALTLFSLADRVTASAGVIAPDVLRDLRVSGDPTLYGVVADGGDDVSGIAYDDRLLLFDLRDPSGLPIVPTDDAGRPLAVAAWRFVPGTTAVVLSDTAGALWWLDPLTGPVAAPLAVTGELLAAEPGAAIVREVGGLLRAVPLPTGEAAVADIAPDLPEARLRLELGAGAAAQVVGEAVWLVAPDGQAEEVYTPAGAGSRIAEVCVSPNGEYLAVEVVSAEGVDDGVPIAPASTASTVYFVRLDTATATAGLAGIHSSWCP